MILFKMALRELISHKKRSIITLILSTFSTALFIFVNALNDGSHAQMIRSGVEVYPGYIQITARGFEDDPSFENLLFDADAVRTAADRDEGVEKSAVRFETHALFSTSTQTIGAMFTAIEPENESFVSRLKRSLIAGEYLDTEDANALYLGSELAKRLNARVGDEISFIATGADYSFAADNLVVKGIFKTKLYEFDNASAFVAKGYFDTVMRSTGIATHIIVQPRDTAQTDLLARKLQKRLGDAAEVKSYTQTMDDVILALEIDTIFGYITLGIFFIVIFFVIAIFAFLSVYARIRQIGILRAVGTTPRQIVSMLLLEALMLGSISVAAGGAAGGYAAWHYEKQPIEFTRWGGVEAEEIYKQYNMVADATLPAEFNPNRIAVEMAIMLLLNLLSVLYPIAMINRFTPTEAIRYV